MISGMFGGQGGSGTPDASLFRAAYYQRIPLVLQQLNFAEWPQFCDHSVTSADVRLSVGPRTQKRGEANSSKPSKRVLILSTIVLGMSTYNDLADLLFGRTRGAILALLFGHADQSFYTRQIAREVDASVGAVQRELENLSKVGLIVRNSVGSQVFYQANRDAPIFREMQGLVNKTVGIFSVLRSALHPLAKRVLVAFVYGSVAGGRDGAERRSLLVVGVGHT